MTRETVGGKGAVGVRRGTPELLGVCDSASSPPIFRPESVPTWQSKLVGRETSPLLGPVPPFGKVQLFKYRHDFVIKIVLLLLFVNTLRSEDRE